MSVLEVRNVSIRYMTGDFKDIGIKEYVLRKLTHNYHVQEFWADRHVTFKLEKGDMLGIIGSNGAGKSTLLKAVSGIMEPTEGSVKCRGNIAALLELASGFDGDLTVRENTYLRGAMLGYTRKYLDETYDEIIRFSELKDFQDRPFKQLSSGMKSRLAFSIASMVQPDILILDEVLSVGDGAFRKKSETKMREIIHGGATTILVSHSLDQVRNMCNKVLWLEKGNQIAFGGDTQYICDQYQQYLNEGKRTLKAALDVASRPKPVPAQEREGKYDYLVVGAGLYGAVFAHEAAARGKKVLVVDKRPHVGGNVYTEEVEKIHVHRYGAHIFHTNDARVWQFVNRFAQFNRFTNSPVANYKGEIYSLPFNMSTFNRMWGVVTPEQAAEKIRQQRDAAGITEPKNLEEQAISLVGTDVYEKLVKGYTEKQWGRPCAELPAFIIRRLPVRLTFDNNYFDALYQGVPNGGYTPMVEGMLEGVEVRLGVDYLENRDELNALAEKVVYTGPIDAYFGHRLGALEYRSLRFETEVLDEPNFQGNATVNYTDRDTPWTRIIEHKWFQFGKDDDGSDIPKTVISREYSAEWKPGDEPYYPVNDEKNSALYAQYAALAEEEKNVIFGGRLGEYKYYDMDQVIAAALDKAAEEMS